MLFFNFLKVWHLIVMAGMICITQISSIMAKNISTYNVNPSDKQEVMENMRESMRILIVDES